MIEQLNEETLERLKRLERHADRLRIAAHHDGRLVDFGVAVRGGLQAGLELATICMGGLGTVSVVPSTLELNRGGLDVAVRTDQPGLACMGCQYGGWQVKEEGYSAIGSGPMRLRRGMERVLDKYGYAASSDLVVGVLESGKLPPESVIESMAGQCGVDARSMYLCVAPTRSVAGTIQIVARSIEAVMHKLFELGADLNKITSAFGVAPLPPPSTDDVTAIGRTNEAILYGGRVTLWTDWSDDEIRELAPGIPANSSPDFGRPFAELFRESGGDFYKLDPMLFSAAVVDLIGNATGNRFRNGELDEGILETTLAMR